MILTMEKACLRLILLSLYMWIWGLDPSDASASKRLLMITHQDKQKIETIELLFNQKPEFQTFRLKDPFRFVIDLKDCCFDKIRETIEVGSPSIERIRIAQFRKKVVRVVVEQGSSFPKPEFLSIAHPMGEAILVTFPFSDKNSSSVPSKNDFMAGNMDSCESTTVKKNAGPVGQGGTIKEKNNFSHLDNTAKLDQESLNTLFSPFDTDIPSQQVAEKKQTARTMTINGDLRNQTAYRLQNPHQFSKIKTDLNLNLSGRVSDRVSYMIGSRLSYDAVFDLTGNYSEDVESDQKKQMDLRDAYIDFSWGDAEFRVGNQQIVWGQAVGLFFADIVNPKDLREYILPDMDQVRIPVPAVNVEYYPGNLYLQLIFIPYPEFNEFGKKGSEFDFSRSVYEQNADLVTIDPEAPADSLDNSELGFRASQLISGWDLSVFYLYDYYNFPINYRYIRINPVGSIHPLTLTYQPEYERMHRFGHTFSKEYIDAVFKGEFIYNHEMYISSSNFADFDGIVKSDTFKWLLGVDYTFFNSLETNFQLMQEIIIDYQEDMLQNQYTTSFSIWLKKEFFGDLIETELFMINSLNQKDYLIRPKITYNYNAIYKLIFGIDFFGGEGNGDFGIFEKSDRAYITILFKF